jgi:hypothetical protein
MMKYRATFRHVRIYVAFLAVISLGTVVIGILVHSTAPAMVGVAIFAYLCAVRFARSITLGDSGFEFNGIVKHWSINWQDIKRFKRMQDYRWPINRMFGYNTYEIQTVHGRKIVSFLFFPGDCLSELKEKIGPNNAMQRIANKPGSR